MVDFFFGCKELIPIIMNKLYKPEILQFILLKNEYNMGMTLLYYFVIITLSNVDRFIKSVVMYMRVNKLLDGFDVFVNDTIMYYELLNVNIFKIVIYKSRPHVNA